jgi:hypothetical protein
VTADCKGCSATVRLAPGELDRLLAEFFATTPATRADEPLAERRLAACGACPDLRYGTTCRHCGCLVAVRARIADKPCPAPTPRWPSVETGAPAR